MDNTARRVAKGSFIALAPDGLTSLGGYPGNDEKGRELQAKVDPEKLMNDFFAAIEFLMGHEATTGKVGIAGFCYGGGVANAAAVAYPELGAAAPFYGRQPKPEDVTRIKAPLLIHYAEPGIRINEGWPAYEAALKEAGKTYQAHIYLGVTTASTTTRHRATTRQRRSSPGSGRWSGSGAGWGEGRLMEQGHMLPSFGAKLSNNA